MAGVLSCVEPGGWCPSPGIGVPSLGLVSLPWDWRLFGEQAFPGLWVLVLCASPAMVLLPAGSGKGFTAHRASPALPVPVEGLPGAGAPGEPGQQLLVLCNPAESARGSRWFNFGFLCSRAGDQQHCPCPTGTLSPVCWCLGSSGHSVTTRVVGSWEGTSRGCCGA